MKSILLVLIIYTLLAFSYSMGQQEGATSQAPDEDFPPPPSGNVVPPSPPPPLPIQGGTVPPPPAQGNVVPLPPPPPIQGGTVPPPPARGNVVPLPPPPPIQGGTVPPPPAQGNVVPPPPPTQGGTVPPPPVQGSLAPSSQGGGDMEGASAAAMWEARMIPLLQPFNYDGENRRNPFKPYQDIQEQVVERQGSIGPAFPLAKWDIDQIQLIGTRLSAKDPKAMFLSPDNKQFILGKGERIGRNNGYIGAIRELEVIVVEPVIIRGESHLVTRIMTMKK